MSRAVGGRLMKSHSSVTKNEKGLRKWWADNWPCWFEWREPGHGCGVGAPDMQIMLGAGGAIIPVELKVGSIGRVVSFELRAPQFHWHNRLAKSGGASGILVGSQASGCKALVKFKECKRFEKTVEFEADTWLEIGELSGSDLADRVIEFFNQSRDD